MNRNYFLSLLLESVHNGISMAFKALIKNDIVPILEQKLKEQTENIQGDKQ